MICAGVCALIAGPGVSFAQLSGPPTVALAGDLSLARLLDLCAQRLRLNIDYDAQALKATATIRLGREIADGELWDLTNRILASRGFTTIEPPGGVGLSVVRLQDAAAACRVVTLSEFVTTDEASRLGPDSDCGIGRPGFRSVLIPRGPSAAGLETLRQMLGKPGGAITVLGGGAILISDTHSRLEQAIDLLGRLEGPQAGCSTERIEVRHVPPSRMVDVAKRLASARTPSAPRGDLFVSADDRAVVVVCPAEDEPAWRGIIGSLDVPGDAERRTYVPRHHAPGDVAALLEQLLSGEAADIVVDSLTGSIIVSAPGWAQSITSELIERLDAMPPSARRPVRHFTLRNRPVSEVASVLGGLIASGTFDAGGADSADSALAPEVATEDGLKHAAAGARRGSISITPDEAANALIVVAEPLVLERLARLIEDLDVRQPQVQVEVLLISLTEGQTRDLGVEIDALIRSGNLSTRLASLFGLSSGGADPARSVGDPAGLTGLVLSPGEFTVVLRALETLNQGRSLSMPRLLVMNNQQGTLDAVLQQPFISVNASDTVATTSFGGTSDAGTTVTVRPQISEAAHLLLEYSVSLSAFVGEASNPSIPPPRQQTRMQSVATIPDGFTIALGGIEVVSDGDAESRIPIVGSVPIIKEAFRSRSRNQSRSRFYVFLRASVLRDRGFEDLKYLSEVGAEDVGIDDGWPRVEPRIIR
ncbi:MAG: hypothetical protein H6811_01570 [Phycisphaeraceae bacterium]|nr:hypothetical protein [Phycisphaeraceae bacterium]